MEFGVPSKRRVSTEKYPNKAVITLLPFEGENTSRKIEFNKKAYEVMSLKKDDTNDVAFSFNKSNYADNSIINANDLGMDAALNLAKNKKISNKAHYEEIKTRYGASMEEELELTLIDSGAEFQGRKVFKLVTLKSHDEAMGEHKRGAELADDEQVEKAEAITDDMGSATAAASVEEYPDDETRAQLDEEDEAKRKLAEQGGTAPSNPWEDVNEEDDLL